MAMGRLRRALDQNTASEAWARPGMDPRQWVSYGTVDDDDDAVTFDEDDGQPYVLVTLHPSEVPVRCRVAMQSAGNGEADWSPFVPNEEVIVLIPEGREDAGCCIIGRLNNAIDSFPMDSVAGQDPTTNAFAFTRKRSPWIVEVAGPILFRSALNEGFISLDTAGVITLKDGTNSALQIGPDGLSYQGPSDESTAPEFLLQMDVTGRHFLLQVGDAVVSFSASDADPEQNTITLPGPMAIGTSGNPPLEHVISTEASANAIAQILLSLAGVIGATGATPLTGTSLAGLITGWLSAGGYAAAWATAATTPLDIPAVVTGVGSAISAAFAASVQKPNTGAIQTNPGIGSPGLLAG